MNIVASGSTYQVYGNDVRLYKNLPAKSFMVCFNKMTGFYLEERADLTVNEEKVYGVISNKVNKVMRSFNLTSRNFGIILSGEKGIGKSLFARSLAQEIIASGKPVITVSIAVPGIENFLASIEQEAMILFDEFDKIYNITEDDDPQSRLLSLFDGTDSGKKLFVITCNDPSKLNDFLINRPGRFHYHFSLQNPSESEIRSYLQDKIKPEYQKKIEQIVAFSQTAYITYDCLRAIAFELNQGSDVGEIMQDLNISRVNTEFDMSITLSNGEVYVSYTEAIDLYSSHTIQYNLRMEKYYGKRIFVYFAGKDIVSKDGKLTIDKDNISFNFTYDRYDELSEEEEEILRKKDKDVTITEIVFNKHDREWVKRYIA